MDGRACRPDDPRSVADLLSSKASRTRENRSLEVAIRIANFYATFCCCRFGMAGPGGSAVILIQTSRHRDTLKNVLVLLYL